MTYEKANAETVQFGDVSFITFSGALAAQLGSAVADALAGMGGCTTFTMDADGEGFACGGFSGGKDTPVTVTVNGVTYVYEWQNNGHKLSNYHL